MNCTPLATQPSPAPSPRLRWAFLAPLGCALHCVAPFAAGPILAAGFLPSTLVLEGSLPVLEPTLWAGSGVIAAFALQAGYRSHRSVGPALVVLVGMLASWGIWGHLREVFPSDAWREGGSAGAALLMAIGLIWNARRPSAPREGGVGSGTIDPRVHSGLCREKRDKETPSDGPSPMPVIR